jgi:hypothetical protein
LTLAAAKLGHIAHIVAAELEGPRGREPLSVDQRNEPSNLMLMCFKHHRIIDDFPERYPSRLLCEWKLDHETRIRRLGGQSASLKTTVLRMTAMIGEQRPMISYERICEAIQPRYPIDETGIEIDLNLLPEPEDSDFWKQGAQLIDTEIARAFRPGIARMPIEHLSVFALAPIPLLVHLGNRIGSLCQTDLFQLHRDTQNWV